MSEIDSPIFNIPYTENVIDVPHFDLPFRLGKTGANVVEQDSLDDVANCVVAIASTHVGWREEVPTFGVPDYALHMQPLHPEDINSVISDQEPRAVLIVNERMDMADTLVDHINIGVSTYAKGGA